ncbi:MAG: glycosyltransferase [Actinomycetota bacterium]|jgi:glycosyltransferase involved in cell wall biosynthesis
MPMPPSYLVLVPFYENPMYLRATMQSVLAQTDQDWSALVVDDSIAGDAAGSVVSELGDQRITYVRNDGNLGVARSFNRCFDLAIERGAQLATILHADDLLEPAYIEVMKAAHAAHPAAACVAPGVTVIDAAGTPSRTVPDTVKNWLRPRQVDCLQGERGLERLLRGQFFYCPSVSYRLAMLRLPAWNTRWQQVMDLELYSRVLLDGGEIRLISRPLFRYRRHDESMTQLNSVTMVRSEEETALCRELVAECVSKGWRRAARAGRFRITVRLQASMRACISLLHRRFGDSWRALCLAIWP